MTERHKGIMEYANACIFNQHTAQKLTYSFWPLHIQMYTWPILVYQWIYSNVTADLVEVKYQGPYLGLCRAICVTSHSYLQGVL